MSQTAALMIEVDRIRHYLGGELPAPEDANRPMTQELEWLRQRLRLSAFERDLLLLCLGMELDPSFPSLCAKAQKDDSLPFPTFQLALGILPEASWECLLTDAPLRYWSLVEIGKGATLLRSPISLPERVMHFLCGLDCPDERLTGLLDREPEHEMDGHRRHAVAEQLARVLAAPNHEGAAFQLYGGNPVDRRRVAAQACQLLGRPLHVLAAERLPISGTELTALIRLWQREVLLSGRVLYVEQENDSVVEGADNRNIALSRVLEEMAGALILGARERRPVHLRPLVYLEVQGPYMNEQYDLWRGALGQQLPALEPRLGQLVSQFNLDAAAIHAAVASLGERGSAGPDERADALWSFCRHHTRPRLGALAQNIEPRARLEDLILPERQKQMLLDLVAQVRLRLQVYEHWGFANKSGRGLGISALFHGTSGTGKTMAAEVLAGMLNLSLYRIDLSSVVSKYIGETEKNLGRIFNAVEGGGAVLLFDEADALFGKRSEVKDSHDRHANIEVSYLLQRLESYRGLAIMTSNLKENIDQAFLRRIRFVLRFPFPEEREREHIWRRTFPGSTPQTELDFARLAKLNVSGGNIRNIAINAAFFAADEQSSVRMKHVLRAAELEYDKLERVKLEIG